MINEFIVIACSNGLGLSPL